MDTIYQLTFFLALGLLAIVITIFVFAVSLLGRAMEAAAKSEKEKLAERKENNAKEMTAIKKEIEEAEANEQIPRGMIRKLQKLEKRDKKFGKELSKIRRAPELLTVKGGVLPVGSCLLGALILNGGAWYLSNGQIFSWIIPVLIWILGLAAIGYSIYGIYRCLRVIESVAITSEQAALLRETEALKRTFRELEEERRPVLELEFKDEQPPFRMETQSERLIKFTVGLSRGDIARDVTAAFFAPVNFEYPDNPDKLPVPGSKYEDYNSARFDFGDIRKPFWRPKSLKFKAPTEPGHYIATYKLYCEGYFSDFVEFEIEVEEQEIPF